ncbi:MAG: hypothetical protein JXM70_13775 [Pirellulales bacterium]|nr:hypothetical protein [Pirellulales bacterium]
MTVAFRELGGSPVEQYDSSGFSARREFLIAWEDRDAFAVEVLGEAARHGDQSSVVYPGNSMVTAVEVKYEPIDAEHPDNQEIEHLAAGLNCYSGSFAKAVVTYDTISPRDRLDGPENEPGTHITYTMSHAVGDSNILPGGWQWTDNSQAISTYYKLYKRLPVTVHNLTWHKVVNPPWATIHALQGTVNDAEFLGCPAGTILFEGGEAEKTFRAGFQKGEPWFAWKIKYVFRERSIKHSGSVYGWNHIYRESPAGWMEITNGNDKLYDSSDHMLLFRSDS